MPVAVVLVHGGALAIEGIKDGADAILDAHYPGLAAAIAITITIVMPCHDHAITITHCPGATEGGRAVADPLWHHESRRQADLHGDAPLLSKPDHSPRCR